MTEQKLIIAKFLDKSIKQLEINISACKWIVHKNVEDRESYLSYNGGNNIVIDDSLFKKIGLLILKHDKQKLEKLKNDFNKL